MKHDGQQFHHNVPGSRYIPYWLLGITLPTVYIEILEAFRKAMKRVVKPACHLKEPPSNGDLCSATEQCKSRTSLQSKQPNLQVSSTVSKQKGQCVVLDPHANKRRELGVSQTLGFCKEGNLTIIRIVSPEMGIQTTHVVLLPTDLVCRLHQRLLNGQV
jgi:hypothetical protein